jgi:hypothetical protein
MSDHDPIRQRALEELAHYVPPDSADTAVKPPDDSFLDIHIDNGVVHVIARPTICPERHRVVIEFVKEVCAIYPEKISGRYLIGMHDMYDNYAEDIGNILVFSKNKRRTNHVMIPDFYAMMNYSGKCEIKDPFQTEDKEPTALFIGGTTGSSNPVDNKRVQLCRWAHRPENSPYVQAYSSGTVQMTNEDIVRAFPGEDVSYLLNPRNIWIPQQVRYKYLISIDGNTASWDRVPWIMASNSVCLKQRSDSACWYYPFLEAGTHYMEFSEFDEIKEIVRENRNYDHIVNNAHSFVSTYLSRRSHLMYMGHILFYGGKTD